MKKIFSILLALAMALSVLPLNVFAAEEDTIVISEGDSIDVDIQEGERVCLEFTPTESTAYVIESIGEYDTQVTLYNSSFEQIGYDDDSGTDSNFKLISNLEEDETYYYEVSSYSSSEAVFTVTFNNFKDSINATAIAVDDSLDFEFQDGDYAYLEFTPSESGTYILESTGSNDTFASLYNSIFEQMESNDDGGDDRNFKISYDLEAYETYYYRVGGYNDYAATFTVTLTKEEETTVDIDIIDINVDDSLDFEFKNGEYAYLKFIPSATGQYIIESTGSSDTYVSLYDSAFMQIAVNDDGGEGGNFKLTYTLEAGQTYYYKVSGYNDNAATFTVTFTRETVSFTTIEVGDSLELDFQDGEFEYLQFTPTDSGEYVLTSSGNDDTYVILYDSAFTQIAVNDDGGLGNNFKIYADLDAGETYYYKVSGYSNNKAKFSVTLEAYECPVLSISIDDVDLIENTNGYYSQYSEYNSETDTYEDYQYYFYSSYYPTNVTVEFKDGTSYTGDPYDLHKQYGDEAEYFSEQGSQNQWTVGNTYEATMVFMGIEAKYNINIIPSPVKSIEIADVELIENCNGEFETNDIYNPETDSYDNVTYFVYSGFDVGTITINFKDGTTFTGSVYDLYEQFDESLSFSNYQEYDKRWILGNTYQLDYSFMGYDGHINVTIVEQPIESIDVANVQVIERTFGYWDQDDSDPNEFFRYSYYMPDELTINFKDGTSFTGSIDEIEEKYNYDIFFTDNQCGANPWLVGNTYEVELSFLGFTKTYGVEIVATPIESVEIPTVSLFEESTGFLNRDYVYNEETGENDLTPEYFYYANFVVKDITINYKDGTSFTGSMSDIYEEYGVWPDIETNQSYENQWVLGGTYGATVWILGYECSFNIKIVDNPIESIEVQDVSVFEHTGGEWCFDFIYNEETGEDERIDYYFYYDLLPDNAVVKVNFKDGTSFSGTADELHEEFGAYSYADSNQDVYHCWLAGNTYEASLSFLGCKTTYNVTVEPITLGDLTGDSNVSIDDYAAIISYIQCGSNLTKQQLLAADVNKDGVVDSFDAIQIDCYLNGICDIYGNEY